MCWKIHTKRQNYILIHMAANLIVSSFDMRLGGRIEGCKESLVRFSQHICLPNKGKILVH